MIGDPIRMPRTELTWPLARNPAGAASSAGGAMHLLSDTAVVAAGDVPETLQETLITAATAQLSRAKLDNIVPHLGASVGEVAGDIQSIEFAIEATAGMAVAKELAASLLGDTDYAVDTAQAGGTTSDLSSSNCDTRSG